MARPLIDYLLRRVDVHLIIADAQLAQAASYRNHPRAELALFDGNDTAAVSVLIRRAAVVVSLLPPAFHPQIAACCLAEGRHLVTTSYVAPAMRSLDEAAKQRGVLLLNEIGLDPGIDHLATMSIAEAVAAEGATVSSFESYCGGLPEDGAVNPFGYQFSWNPRGALSAMANPARYLRDGAIVDIAGRDVLSAARALEISDKEIFEEYPNRDSLTYRDVYGFSQARTFYRATLRYPGFALCMRGLRDLGLFSQDPFLQKPASFAEFRALLSIGNTEDAIAERLEQKGYSREQQRKIVKAITWLGFTAEALVPTGIQSPFDLLSLVMQERLAYAPGERDRVLLYHRIISEGPRGKTLRTFLLEEIGIAGQATAMAKTVGLPAALAVELILDGRVAIRGVQIPTLPELYRPLLVGLRRVGVRFSETCVAVEEITKV